jgi:peroxiredoxin
MDKLVETRLAWMPSRKGEKMFATHTEDGLGSAQADLDAELTMAAAAEAASNALRAGSRAPLFTLPDAAGERVSLEDLLSAGPVVLHFFRGDWCTFGEQSLADFASHHADVIALGASAVAIAPPGKPAHTHNAAGGLRQLLDDGMKLARAYGVAFELPVRLRGRYEELGYQAPSDSKANRWLVTVPATFLLDRDGRIAMAYVDVDYRKRLDTGSLLSALKALQTRHAATRSANPGRLARGL